MKKIIMTVALCVLIGSAGQVFAFSYGSTFACIDWSTFSITGGTIADETLGMNVSALTVNTNDSLDRLSDATTQNIATNAWTDTYAYSAMVSDENGFASAEAYSDYAKMSLSTYASAAYWTDPTVSSGDGRVYRSFTLYADDPDEAVRIQFDYKIGAKGSSEDSDPTNNSWAYGFTSVYALADFGMFWDFAGDIGPMNGSDVSYGHADFLYTDTRRVGHITIGLQIAYPDSGLRSYAIDKTQDLTAPPAPVPEPATLTLLCIGFPCLAYIKRKRRK